jgi:hypothetical protein
MKTRNGLGGAAAYSGYYGGAAYGARYGYGYIR